ncbi:unnamed protein product [Calypogeia fissa]
MTKASYEMLADIRNSIEDILGKMLQVKKEGKGTINLRELLTEASVMFVDLRQVNRLILQEEDRVKSETESAKLPVDHTTLQLHNLLYEKNYYLKAIKACKDFKSKYPDIDLVSEEEFFRDASEELKADPTLREDPHKLNLQRLNFELHQRKELCKQREQLDARKKLLQESIANRRKFLSSLPSHLKALKKASLPVQQQLGILHTKRVKQHQLAELLPPPLYILYSQFLSQKDAFGESIEVEIMGSAKDAQTVARQQANREAAAAAGVTEEAKIEEDLPDEDDDSQRRRKRVKKSHDKENTDGAGLYQAHPLTIVLQIYDDEQPATDKANKLLTIVFEFLPKLNIVCAGIEGSSQGPEPDNLLVNLFPNDTGLDLPNQVSKLQAGGGFVFDEKRTLRPFKWVQHLAGIDFLPETPPLLPDSGCLTSSETPKGFVISSALTTYRQQHRVFTVLQQLRARKKAHLALKEQLESLSKLKQPALKATTFPWVVHVPKCTLRTWTEIEVSGLDQSLYAMAGGQVQAALPSPCNNEAVGVATPTDMEMGREDGELPSSAVLPTVGTSSSGSRLPNGSEGAQEVTDNPGVLVGSAKDVVKTPLRGNVGEKRSRRGENIVKSSPIQREDAILAGIRSSLLPGFDALLEDGMEGLEMDVVVEDIEDETSASKSASGWETYGIQTYRAVLRRESGAGGKRLELEAQVEVCPEYPLRPPVFHLRLLPSGVKDFVTLPAAPPGLLDVTESMVIGEPQVEERFNELRAIEAEVNIHLPGTLPKGEINYTLAHQLSLLIMLYDQEVDLEISSHRGQGPGTTQSFLDNPVGKVGQRTVRGRDRRTAIAWNERQGLFEYRS